MMVFFPYIISFYFEQVSHLIRTRFFDECFNNLDWGKAFSQRYEQLPDPNINLDRNKILKVGYVSADMSTHSVAYFSEVFLRDMDPRQVQLFIYSNSPVIDHTTRRLMSYPNLTWRQIEGLLSCFLFL